MKRSALLMMLLLLPTFLAGCLSAMPGLGTSMLTGVNSASYDNPTVVLAYNDPDVIRDQSRVATLVLSKSRYGITIDAVPVKTFEGEFNPDLRISRNANDTYIVDVPPGTHTLVVTYEGNAAKNEPSPTPAPGSGATVYKSGGTSVTASVTGVQSLISWERTSETTHTLKGGDVFAVGLKLMTISGDIDLYSVGDNEKAAITTARNSARF